MFDDVERASGPLDEARQSSISNWFFQLGRGITAGVDDSYRYAAPISNGGVNFGVGADGQIYVQGSTGGVGGASGAAGGFTLSPTLILMGLGLWFLIRKG